MNTLSIPIAHLRPLDRLAAEEAVREIAGKFPEVQVRLDYAPGADREESFSDRELRARFRTELDHAFNLHRAVIEETRRSFDPAWKADDLRAGLYRHNAVQLATELAKTATPDTVVTKNLVLELIDRLNGPLPAELLAHARRDSHTYAFRHQDWSAEEIASTIDRTREFLAHELWMIANDAPFHSTLIREDILAGMMVASAEVPE